MRSFTFFAISVAALSLTSCKSSGSSPSFAELRDAVQPHAAVEQLDVASGPTSGILASSRLQGRILTARVGAVESSGYVPVQTIAEGETHEHFNNFGGLDRFWIGPESGQFGVYFPPGAKELTRDNWQVPADFDTGAFEIVGKTATSIDLRREMRVTNLRGVEFHVRVDRRLGVLSANDLPVELGVEPPSGVHYTGCYSDNTMTNVEKRDWNPQTGLLGIWILGMFNASDHCVVIAPFHAGEAAELGSEFNDDYFGKVSVDTPERLRVVDNAVIFRGDAKRVGKFGLSQRRTRGLAGSYDFEKNLLIVVQFTLPETPERYGNSQWDVEQSAPYGGDAFQSYNNGDAENPGALAADAFYELESASPVRPLKSGQSISHRHVTHHFQGPPDELATLAKKLLGVDLGKVRAEMGL